MRTLVAVLLAGLVGAPAFAAPLTTEDRLSPVCERPIMVVWLHGSRGWKNSWKDGFYEKVDRKWLPRCAKSVFPDIRFSRRFFEHQMPWQMRKDARRLAKQLGKARRAHGELPTVYVGTSRGGLLALYAARRDPHAVFVLNIVGSVNDESQMRQSGMGSYIPQWRRRELAAVSGAGRPTPSLWIYGAQDPYTPIGHARAMHAAYGGPGEFVEVADAGHGIPWKEVVRPLWVDVLERHTGVPEAAE